VVGDGGIYFLEDNGHIVIFDTSVEHEIAEIENVNIGSSFELSYNKKCDNLYFWGEDGDVIRYTRQLNVFGISLRPDTPCGVTK
jgi:hypothetical protein